MIAVKNLVKHYEVNGQVIEAVRGVNLQIEKGDFSALAGPSGSGKTTILNMIGGLDYPTSGTISIGGEIINDYNPKRMSEMRLRKIGFVFQAYNLIPVLTCIENVEYILLLQGIEKSERRARASEILDEVGLEKEKNRKPNELSGGQQQRVAIARAIVSKPDIILADEPTANLDQKTGADLLDMMHSLNRSKNITFLFSTHDPMVMDRSDRIIRLKDGIIEKDEVKNILNNTATATGRKRI